MGSVFSEFTQRELAPAALRHTMLRKCKMAVVGLKEVEYEN